MDADAPSEKPDLTLSKLGKDDLYELSVGDLEDRIASLKAEIARCEKAMADRGGARSEAEALFKS
ncbi:MAG: DUF1192 domain-containing protein [Pseudomonadota bacterium]